MGRVAAQNAKGVIIQKVREADKSRQYDEYKDKIGEIAIGIVKRIFPHNWDGEKAFADIQWSNPKIAVRWAISSPIAV